MGMTAGSETISNADIGSCHKSQAVVKWYARTDPPVQTRNLPGTNRGLFHTVLRLGFHWEMWSRRGAAESPAGVPTSMEIRWPLERYSDVLSTLKFAGLLQELRWSASRPGSKTWPVALATFVKARSEL